MSNYCPNAAPPRFWAAYLTALVFFLTIALGGLFFVLLQFATRAGWSTVVRRLAENAMATLPLVTVLFAPVLWSTHVLYPWAAPGAALYWLVWLGLAGYFYRASVAQDSSGEHEITRRLQRAAPVGLILFGLALTWAAFDWLMSLSSPWYSTMYGVYVFAGAVVAIMAFLVLVCASLQGFGRLRREITTEHYHDLGKLLFAFVVFWAYIAFSQFMLIWYGNLPEETVYYAQRYAGSWLWVCYALALGQFVVPFIWLLSRRSKRNLWRLVPGALWILAMHYVDIYWLIMPHFTPQGASFAWVDLLTFGGIGGLFGGAYFWLLAIRPLLPLRDPRLHESLAFENA